MEIQRKFDLGDTVRKTKGSSWHGRIVGYYSTSLTPIGYAVESVRETGSVQVYPEAALEPIELCPVCADVIADDDICATDFEMGICHAACLEGSPVVDLDTGEETGGKISTFIFADTPTTVSLVASSSVTAEGVSDQGRFESGSLTEAGGIVPSEAASKPAVNERSPQSHTPADQIISQIEDLFPNWRSYRDLVDCLTCELHELRKRAGSDE